MKNLTTEERELLHDLIVNSDSLKIVLLVLENMVTAVEKDVIRFSLVDSDEDAPKLMRVKCEALGARKLFNLFRTHLQGIRLAEQKKRIVNNAPRKRTRSRNHSAK